jgi:hypothetical protein
MTPRQPQHERLAPCTDFLTCTFLPDTFCRITDRKVQTHSVMKSELTFKLALIESALLFAVEDKLRL